MALKSILLSLIAPAAVLAAAPAMAQDAAAQANLPTCSATVTDHCVQRGGSGHAMGHMKNGHHASRHHRMARHHHKAKHHMAKHHKARHHMAKHHAMTHHAAAMPAGAAAPAKPKG